LRFRSRHFVRRSRQFVQIVDRLALAAGQTFLIPKDIARAQESALHPRRRR
jgi:hypothetical protein